ncbi:MAG: DUF4412 domain-containing protein [Alphaproteobacteria bacterium]
MRNLLASAALCLGLAACGQQGAGSSAPATPAGFPRPTASYVGKYQMHFGDMVRPMTLYRDGGKIRMEGPPPAAVKAEGVTVATVMDQATKKLVTFRVGPNAPKAAMTMSLDKIGEAASLFDADKDQPQAKAVGEDKIAGLSCRIWETPPATEGAVANQVCVTNDGIMLRMNKAGEADKPTMIAEEIKRGPQDSALFAPPADYEVVDYSRCTNMAAEAMAAAKAGQKPDMSKLQECAALGKKVSAIFGG